MRLPRTLLNCLLALACLLPAAAAAEAIPGEPMLRHFSEWGQIATATASYGYGFSLNSLHLVRAYAALANDGLMPQLKLVKGGAPLPPQRAVSAKTAWVIPDGMDVRHAAVIPVTFGTADDCLFEFGRLVAGESVLVQAGADEIFEHAGRPALHEILAAQMGARFLARRPVVAPARRHLPRMAAHWPVRRPSRPPAPAMVPKPLR